jgi:hypothetical protein
VDVSKVAHSAKSYPRIGPLRSQIIDPAPSDFLGKLRPMKA